MSASLPRRVLYVEDDRVAALLFVEALRDAPQYEVEVAESGAEALQLAERWQPDVLVLDAHLPDITGLMLLPRLRALPGLLHVPAFFCSADALLPEDLSPNDGSISGCWLKPVQRSQMLADLAALPAPPSHP